MSQRISSCTEALKADSVDPQVLYQLGVALSLTRDYARAESTWARYARLSPGEFAGHYNLGLSREARREYGAALGAFRDAIQVATNETQRQLSCFHVGVAAFNTGHRETALRSFRAAASMDTADLGALSAAALAAHSLGRDSEAVSYWEKIRAAQPNFLDSVSAGERAAYLQSRSRAGPQRPASLTESLTCPTQVDPGRTAGRPRRPSSDSGGRKPNSRHVAKIGVFDASNEDDG